jgi:hypothetical protein
MRVLLLLLLLLCVTERKSLTDVVSTGQNTKKRGPRESFVSIERFFVFSFFSLLFSWFFDLFDSFFVFFILNEKGILTSKLLLLLN